jgi:hypothetical protein
MIDKAGSEPRSAAAWMAVLEEMQTTLGRSLDRAVEPDLAPPPDPATVAMPLQALDDRLARLQGCLERAEQTAQEADAVLDAEAQAMQRWLEAMRQAGCRLAELSRRPS